jgi:hypothetical protein
MSEINTHDNKDDVIKVKNSIISELTSEIDQLRKFLYEQEKQNLEQNNELISVIKEKDKNIVKLEEKMYHKDGSTNQTKTATTFNKKHLDDDSPGEIKGRTAVDMEISDTDSDPTNDIKPPKSKEVINEWDDNANITLRNWYYAFKEISHSYQYILDRNYRISSKLSLASVVSSSALSIFAGIKLWIPDDKIFQSSSNIVMLVSNLVIAGITTMSKRYIDDNRNEKIRTYIEEIDKFMNLVYAQYCLSPVYRINAKEFFKSNNEKYTSLMISAPNLSISEMEMAKRNYKNYRKTFHNHEHDNNHRINSNNEDTVEV